MYLVILIICTLLVWDFPWEPRIFNPCKPHIPYLAILISDLVYMVYTLDLSMGDVEELLKLLMVSSLVTGGMEDPLNTDQVSFVVVRLALVTCSS